MITGCGFSDSHRANRLFFPSFEWLISKSVHMLHTKQITGDQINQPGQNAKFRARVCSFPRLQETELASEILQMSCKSIMNLNIVFTSESTPVKTSFVIAAESRVPLLSFLCVASSCVWPPSCAVGSIY